MKERLQKRLQSLNTEYEAGQKMLAELEAKQANLRDTLLRISGAVQVLEEVLTEAEQTPEANGHCADGLVPAEAISVEAG
jgi:predicted nuclease with TOPRIM domain